MSLFRREALDAQHQHQWGEVLLAPPLRYQLFTASVFIIVMVSLMFLFTASYHKKEVVIGQLKPTEGIVKSFSPSEGLIASVHVHEGEIVDKEQVLFTMHFPKVLSSGQDMHAQLTEELNQQINALTLQINNMRSIFAAQKASLQSQLEGVGKRQKIIQQQLKEASSNVTLAQSRLADSQVLNHEQLLANNELRRFQEQVIHRRQQLLRLRTEFQTGENERQSLNHQLSQLPIEQQNQLSQLKLVLSEKRGQLLQWQSRSELLIKSSKAGKVTAINVKEGQKVRPSQYLASLLPANAELYAELLIPTHAFGFVAVGQETRIKLEAFPYQKFGVLLATINQLSENIVVDTEIQFPFPVQEPVYKASASLPQQYINAYGKNMNLQAGMLLKADVLIDRRSLFEWLFEPLFSLYQ